jgi:hypothetical protein
MPLAQAIRWSTGLIAWRRLVVPLGCGVRVGALPGEVLPGGLAGDVDAREQPAAVRARAKRKWRTYGIMPPS